MRYLSHASSYRNADIIKVDSMCGVINDGSIMEQFCRKRVLSQRVVNVNGILGTVNQIGGFNRKGCKGPRKPQTFDTPTFLSVVTFNQ
uniref:Uncharacterized protein n=1 Tax=Pararge aegeria TaxID=116150 RepID=S4P4C3_9NEOP